MSRIAKNPVTVPKGVDVTLNGQSLSIKGSNGTMSLDVHELVTVAHEGDEIKFGAVNESKNSRALSGTMRSLANNIVIGVSKGFEKKLELVGVGYRAAAKGKVLNLTLGFSHPVDFEAPEGITIETPSQTEIIIKGMNKQVVGETAAKIRAYRPPEPYKGKGVKYAGEHIVRKEAKKK